MKQVSLRIRMLVLVLLITFITFIIVGVTSYKDAKNSILNSLHDNAATQVQNRAENLSEWMQAKLALVEVMSRAEQVRFGTDEERLAYFRKEAERSEGVFGSIGFADLNGRLPLSSGETIHIADEPTFKKVLQGNYEISDPFRGQLSDKLLFTLQVPVYGNDDEIIGLVNAAILMETTVHLNLNFKIGKADSISLFTKSGKVVYPSDISSSLQGIASDLFQYDHGSKEIQANSSHEILFYATVPKADWHIVLEVPLKEFEAPLQALFRKTVITIMLAMAVMVWFLFMMFNREFTRIRQLVAITETVAAGNFNVPSIPFSRKDELGELAESINAMIHRLRDMFLRIEVMINQNGSAMMSLDKNYVVNYFSKAAEELLGFKSEEVIGKATPLWFIPLDELERVAAELTLQLGREVAPDLSVFMELRNLHDSYETEWTFVRKDGSRISVLHNSNGVKDLNGELTGIVVITRDITQQKRAQAELLLAKQEAEEANLAKGEFVARISHEIRTPLSGIIGLAQLMQKSTMNDIQRDYIDKMLNSSRTMLAIINEILDFSKVEAGKLELESISFSPENLLNKIADMISVFLIEKDQFDFIVDMPDSVPDALIGDPTRLEQILLNLCSNAVKFTESGHVILKMEGLKQIGTELEVRFTVEDTGIGMSPLQLDRLFSPYSQGDDSTSRKYGGTGLGLFISKSLIEIMGSTLEVQSEVDIGSRFFFTLHFEVPHLSGKEKLLLPARFRQTTVWLVEDSSRMRAHFIHILSSFALQPIEFATWKEALHNLQRGAAAEGSMIILDMEALDMYGPETFYEFSQAAAAKGIYLLAMTSAYGREELNRMPPAVRPEGILLKPVSRMNLYRSMISILERREVKNGQTDIRSSMSKESGKGKILLAEDYEINRQVALALLEDHGFEVGVAVNGYEVLAMLEESGWDLVLMDIQMPDMDGKETTRRIRQDRRFAHIPIIAMTAYAMQREQEVFIGLGMNDTLSKPIEEEALLEAIQKWINKPQELIHQAEEFSQLHVDELPPLLGNLNGIQVVEALTRLNGKVSIFIQMLHTFKRDFFDYPEKIREAFEHGEFKEFKHLVHSLRGAAGSLSAERLYAAVGSLEDSFDSEKQAILEFDHLLEEVTLSFREVIVSLDKLD